MDGFVIVEVFGYLNITCSKKQHICAI